MDLTSCDKADLILGYMSLVLSVVDDRLRIKGVIHEVTIKNNRSKSL